LELGGRVEKFKTAEDFRRRVVRRGEEAVVVDLVRDRAPQGRAPKVDVYALEKAGFRIEEAMPLAQQKDAGLTPLQLEWVLSQIDLTRLPDGKVVLAKINEADDTPTRSDLQQFLSALSRRLLVMSPHP
jgi:hypothetical protein